MTNPTFETLEIGADDEATIKLSREVGAGSKHTEMTVTTYTDEGEEGAKESAQVTVSGNWDADFAPFFARALEMWQPPYEDTFGL